MDTKLKSLDSVGKELTTLLKGLIIEDIFIMNLDGTQKEKWGIQLLLTDSETEERYLHIDVNSAIIYAIKDGVVVASKITKKKVEGIKQK